MRQVLIGFVVALAGCSGQKAVEDFTPAADNARKSLEVVLNHWQGGGAPGTIPDTKSPTIEATDTKWKQGAKLKSYEIVGEEPVTGPGPRMFKVRLTPPTGPSVETKYAVLGIDPLLVYRDEDFQKLSGAGR